MADQMLEVVFDDGSRWQLPARPLAERRADYYATKVDGHAKGSAEWEAEVLYALSEAGEDDLLDYVHNNVSWVEVESVATMVQGPQPADYRLAWHSASLALTK